MLGRLKAGAILERLFDEEPSHPELAHYIIHTYEVLALAPRALVAARRYSEIAPDALTPHMPSHTFTCIGYWQESSRRQQPPDARARQPKNCTLATMSGVAALQGHRDQAFENLRQAIDHGYSDPEEMASDDAWKPLRNDHQYQTLFAEVRRKSHPN